MLNMNIKLLVLAADDFENGTLPEVEKIVRTSLYWKLKPYAQIAFTEAELVFVGNFCIKNRFGSIQDGKPIF